MTALKAILIAVPLFLGSVALTTPIGTGLPALFYLSPSDFKTGRNWRRFFYTEKIKWPPFFH